VYIFIIVCIFWCCTCYTAIFLSGCGGNCFFFLQCNWQEKGDVRHLLTSWSISEETCLFKLWGKREGSNLIMLGLEILVLVYVPPTLPAKNLHFICVAHLYIPYDPGNKQKFFPNSALSGLSNGNAVFTMRYKIKFVCNVSSL